MTVRRPSLGALVVYTALALAFTAPILSHLDSAVLGGTQNDATLAARQYWAAAAEHSNPFTQTRDALNGAPEGAPVASAIQLIQPVQPGLVWLLRNVTGIIGALNLYLLFGLILTPWSIFLLTRDAGLGFWPCLTAGAIAGFNPWVIDRVNAGHFGFVQGWVLALTLWLILRLQARPVTGRAALVGAATGLAFLITPYMGLLALVIGGAGGLVVIARMGGPRRVRRVAWLLGVVLGSVLVPLVPGLVAFLHQRVTVAGAIDTGLASIGNVSASLRSYVFPATWSPLFGGLGHRFGSPHFPTETVLFVGYTTLVLALVAVVTLIRRRGPQLAGARANLVITSSLLVPIAVGLSLPPWWHVDLPEIGRASLPLPSAALNAATSYYRVYARIGDVAMIALAILAAQTLDSLARRKHGNALVAVLMIAIAIELLPAAPRAWSLRTVPDYDLWLREHPGGTVADYPSPLATGAGIGVTRAELDYQVRDGHPRYNFFEVTLTDTREGAIRELSSDPGNAETPAILAAERVRYVVIHDAAYRTAGLARPRVATGLRLIARFPDARIYAVTSSAVNLTAYLRTHIGQVAEAEAYRDPPVTIGGTGFFGPEKYAGDSAPRHWLGQDGILDIAESGQNTVRTRYRLSFFAFSSVVPRRVSVVLPNGRAVASAEVPTTDSSITLGPFQMPPTTARLTLRVDPSPAPLSTSDTRVTSIYISPPALTVIPDVTTSLVGS